jgi:hypothetical protein
LDLQLYTRIDEKLTSGSEVSALLAYSLPSRQARGIGTWIPKLAAIGALDARVQESPRGSGPIDTLSGVR